MFLSPACNQWTFDLFTKKKKKWTFDFCFQRVSYVSWLLLLSLWALPTLTPLFHTHYFLNPNSYTSRLLQSLKRTFPLRLLSMDIFLEEGLAPVSNAFIGQHARSMYSFLHFPLSQIMMEAMVHANSCDANVVCSFECMMSSWH